MKIERFEDIEDWQLARELTRKVYRLTKKTRFAKDYGLKRQIQDAAGSSMHNIAEGFDSETNGEFMRFLRYAKRSCTEVQSVYEVHGMAHSTIFYFLPSRDQLFCGTYHAIVIKKRASSPEAILYHSRF
ncbi:MAG: four helix bundle protein [Desulfobacteraceae bacterium]|nr:four helix bundle protein [Desulfobacteraceae bacterium]